MNAKQLTASIDIKIEPRHYPPGKYKVLVDMYINGARDYVLEGITAEQAEAKVAKLKSALQTFYDSIK